eukprot:m51a1_g14087 hypothetical protein (1760) ;mRNA; f:18686-31090
MRAHLAAALCASLALALLQDTDAGREKAALCALLALAGAGDNHSAALCADGRAAACPQPLGAPWGCYARSPGNYTVSRLNMTGLGLRGTLPNISALKNLRSLNVEWNFLEGTLPDYLANFACLTSLSMGHTRLSGQIPNLQPLERLLTLSLANNKHAGTLPPWPPIIRNIYLQSNYITGTIPQLPATIEKISLMDNGLTGEIQDLRSLPKLSFLNVAQNMISGTIPPMLPTLKTLVLKNNLIGGTLPQNASFYPPGLLLDLRNTLVTGDVPAALNASLCNLTSTCMFLEPLRASQQRTDCIVSMRTDGKCAVCRRGTYSATGAPPCTRCPADRYSSAGATRCLGTCAPGSYATGVGCSPCVRGGNGSACMRCAAGFVWNWTDDGGRCFECGRGYTSDGNETCLRLGGTSGEEGQSGPHWIAPLIAAGASALAGVLLVLSAIVIIAYRKRKVVLLQKGELGLPGHLPLEAVPVTPDNDVTSLSLSVSTTASATASAEELAKSSSFTEMTAQSLWSARPAVLNFGLAGDQADIGQEISQDVVLSNRERRPIHFSVEVPTSNKFAMRAVPCEGRIRPGESARVAVSIVLHCTTSVSEQVAVRVSRSIVVNSEGYSTTPKRDCRMLAVSLEGKLSARVDYDEIVLKDIIGQGSFGVVYKGVWRGNVVAVKQVVSNACYDFKELRHEADIMESVRSPYVVKFIGAAFVPGKSCILTEYLPLGNLRSVAKRYKLSATYKLHALHNVARGMKFLHDSNILHRDLKPDNVLVAALSTTCDAVCKITDFGTSREVSNEASVIEMTTKIGTPIFMAPEVLSGGSKYAKSADVYSFAMLTYELLFEHSPYTEKTFETQFALAQYVVNGHRPVIPDSCTGDIRDILLCCWQRNPEQRPTFEQLESLIHDMRLTCNDDGMEQPARTEQKRDPDDEDDLCPLKHPGKVHVWGCFSAEGFGRLYTFTCNLNSKKLCHIYNKALLPSAKKMFGPAPANPGYAATQAARLALPVAPDQRQTAAERTSAAQRRAERAGQWTAVLGSMLSGALRVGSRTPTDAPAWATPEVLPGGFASGRLLAELSPSDASNASVDTERLAEMLETGCYRVALPEHAVLLAVAWLQRSGHAADAQRLVDAVVAPWAPRLRFYPDAADTPLDPAPRVSVSSCARVRAALEATASLGANPLVRRARLLLSRRAAHETWAPLRDDWAALWAATLPCEHLPQYVRAEGTGRVALRPGTTAPLLRGPQCACARCGWPCEAAPGGWADSARALLRRYDEACEAQRAEAQRLAGVYGQRVPLLNGEPVRRGSALHTFVSCARVAVAGGGALPARDVAVLRSALAGVAARHGLRGTEPWARLRAQRERAVGPDVFAAAREVAARLAARVGDQRAGVEDPEALLGPLESSAPVPARVAARVRSARVATVPELVRAGLVPSGEVLAALVPAVAAHAEASAAVDDPAARRLLYACLEAFSRRRSLLLLNLERQVRADELPWVAALRRCATSASAPAEAARAACAGAMAMVAGEALRAFPQTIVPNKLLQSLKSLARAAGSDVALTEELASDIFMGAFSPAFVRSAAHAARAMEGTFYADYYGLADAYAQLRGGAVTPEAFAALCHRMAGLGDGGARRGWSVADNGKVIEQQQILTTHNLAQLVDACGLRGAVDWAGLCERVWRWVVGAAGRVPEPRQRLARLRLAKDVAYAWRQLVFFYSLAGDRAAVVARLREALQPRGGKQRPYAERLHELLRSLEQPAGCRVLRAWVSGGNHWLWS